MSSDGDAFYNSPPFTSESYATIYSTGSGLTVLEDRIDCGYGGDFSCQTFQNPSIIGFGKKTTYSLDATGITSDALFARTIVYGEPLSGISDSLIMRTSVFPDLTIRTEVEISTNYEDISENIVVLDVTDSSGFYSIESLGNIADLTHEIEVISETEVAFRVTLSGTEYAFETVFDILGLLTGGWSSYAFIRNDQGSTSSYITSDIFGVISSPSPPEPTPKYTRDSLDLFKHLLPRALAWTLTPVKQLRSFFKGLGIIPAELKNFIDLIWLDVFPSTTRALDEWEAQFGLFDYGLSEDDRRARLSATWQATGGQSPKYIQDTLQAAGFDVYVHEWWSDLTPTARDPLSVLAPDNITPVVSMGYPLVNKLYESVYGFNVSCGEPDVSCGEPDVSCGEYDLTLGVRQYNTTTDPDTWPYYLYIGGEVFGDLANIDLVRKNEFERLCLKICPAQLWLGMLVTYI